MFGVWPYISALLAPAGATSPYTDFIEGGLPSLPIAALADICICHRQARPVPGLGIQLPGFAAALVAIGMSWLLLSGPAELPYRPPVAFVAGVLGPLVGADLHYLRDITRVPIGILSIGGAGTFDGSCCRASWGRCWCEAEIWRSGGKIARYQRPAPAQ